jgi:putative two-component system response regulator
MQLSVSPKDSGPALGQPARPDAATLDPFLHAPATVLVADDVEANREMIREMLEPLGCRVVCAEDGEKALQMAQSEAVDVVLLDVVMPCLTGYAVCQELKSNPATRLIPVVLVTALTERAERLRGIEAGADDFLTKPVSREEVVARVRSLVKLKRFTDELENAEGVLFSLARSIEAKDPYTGGHCERLSAYSVALGSELGLNSEQIVALRRAGIVHDIGKVAVPDHILLKPGPLTAEERKLMELHTIVGERICAPLRSFRLVLPIIRHHHEKLDGSGYPDGLKGEQIPITARVLQVVDVFDALTTHRPYRKALRSGEALAVLRAEAKRGWWDMRLVEKFAEIVPALLEQHGGEIEQGLGAER